VCIRRGSPRILGRQELGVQGRRLGRQALFALTRYKSNPSLVHEKGQNSIFVGSNFLLKKSQIFHYQVFKN
jgi:hypothetical protein